MNAADNRKDAALKLMQRMKDGEKITGGFREHDRSLKWLKRRGLVVFLRPERVWALTVQPVFQAGRTPAHKPKPETKR